MATSSMHKPGWRSRRRSRLSLVERAVPRLGRMPPPEDGTKAIRPSETKAPLPSGSPPRIQSREKSGEDQAKPLSRDARGADDKPSDSGDIERFEAESPPPIADGSVPGVAGDELAATERSADDGAPAIDASLPAVETPPVQQTPDAARSVDGAVRAPATGPMLALDWDRLVESGFTDPRNRSEPLPANMDEIIRALIRQALSDQSSWRDRVILVTSPYERTSKTTAAINFAFGLTTVANHHAVLVDVDTTGAGAVERLGGGHLPGIAGALADHTSDLNALAIRTDLGRLTLVASGTADDETMDRFASRRMLQILRHLTEHPDTILVIDAPPILISQEAAVLSVIAGQVVLAVEAGRTTADQIDHALQRIGERHNVSLVLNESSGRAGGSAPSTVPATSVGKKRKSADPRRRLPKAAALAGAVALCMIPPAAGGLMRSATAGLLPEPAISDRGVTPPERWSIDIACRRDCR